MYYKSNGAEPYSNEELYREFAHDPEVRIEDKGDEVLLHVDFEQEIGDVQTTLITTELLGATIVSECIYEQPDGSPYVFDKDYFGKSRRKSPAPGPFSTLALEKKALKIW